MKKIFILIVVGLMPTTLANSLWAQNAEELYQKDYCRFELMGGTDILFTTKNTCPYYQYLNAYSYDIGLKYNFFQKNTINLSAGFHFTTFDITDVVKSNFIVESTAGPLSYLELPFEFQQIYKLSPARSYFFYSLGAAVIIDYYDNDSYSGSSGNLIIDFMDVEGSSYNYNYYTNEISPLFNVGLSAGIGILIPTKPLLLKIQLNARQNLLPYLLLDETLTFDGNTVYEKQRLGWSMISLNIGISFKRGLIFKEQKKWNSWF